MSERYYIGKAHWLSILHGWSDKYQIVASQAFGKEFFFMPVDESKFNTIIYDQIRTVQPLKSFLLPALEEVTKDQIDEHKPNLFLGVKACDLHSLSIIDKAFGGDFSDPGYKQRRNNSVIVSADCSDPRPSCFCTQVDEKPYAMSGFDLNLSKIWDGLIVEVGSKRGKQLLEGHDKALKEVVKEEAETQAKIRHETVRRVQANNIKYKFADQYQSLFKEYWDSSLWVKHSETCVECGACNHACPTCHCYFLDDVTRKVFTKLRGWDSCHYAGYAVTAGGGTPRPRLSERFRNRYLCKFSYLPANYSQLGCTGCGRCIDACQGKIDMRVLLSELNQGVEE
ncbi:4Fe-4S dicluster domain-containing protein [bacterium]|nr:4Fe-4S dicluster domain-containing protein [bacterium]